MSRHLSIEPDPFAVPAANRARLPVRVAAQTDLGLERDNNEDRAAFADLGDVFVALVCDGMGGEAGGEIASRLAVETIVPFLRDLARTKTISGIVSEGHVARALVASIEAAASRIKEEGVREPRYARMGTTATLAAVVDRTLAAPRLDCLSQRARGRALVCAQVGDSRAYLQRGDVLCQLTRDQTMAELLRSNGSVPADQIHELVGSNIILQAVGSSTRLDVAITHTELNAGDTILLCSDGLHGVVPDQHISETLAAYADPERACAALIARAIEAGAPDNVTCVVLRLGS